MPILKQQFKQCLAYYLCAEIIDKDGKLYLKIILNKESSNNSYKI